VSGYYLTEEVPQTKDDVDARIKEINSDLEALAKLKPGPWWTKYSGVSAHWHDDPSNQSIEIMVYGNTRDGYTLASGTIFNTQREVMFMAAARELVPELLEREKKLLLILRKRLKRGRS